MDVSVVITNYNKGMLLDRAVRSSISQVLIRKIHEVVVVDDGSTDNSLDSVSDILEQCVVVRHDENKGVAAASNSGLSVAQGSYWMRVDADDYLSQFALQYMSAILDANPNIGFVTADHSQVSPGGKTVEVVSLQGDEALLHHGAGVLFRRHILEDVGGYDEALQNGEDYDLISRLMAAGISRFHLPIPLYRYFKQTDGLTEAADRHPTIRKLGEMYGHTF